MAKIKSSGSYKKAADNITKWTEASNRVAEQDRPTIETRECEASHYQLGAGWKCLILATFLFTLWLLANPHYEPAQRIHISNPDYFLNKEYQRPVPAQDIVCTKDIIVTADMSLIGKRWIEGGQCAWVEDYQQLVLFKRG